MRLLASRIRNGRHWLSLSLRAALAISIGSVALQPLASGSDEVSLTPEYFEQVTEAMHGAESEPKCDLNELRIELREREVSRLFHAWPSLVGCEWDRVYVPRASREHFYTSGFFLQRRLYGTWLPKINVDCEELFAQGADSTMSLGRRVILGTRGREVAARDHRLDGFEVDPGTYRYNLVVASDDPAEVNAGAIRCRVLHSTRFDLTAVERIGGGTPCIPFEPPEPL